MRQTCSYLTFLLLVLLIQVKAAESVSLDEKLKSDRKRVRVPAAGFGGQSGREQTGRSALMARSIGWTRGRFACDLLRFVMGREPDQEIFPQPYRPALRSAPAGSDE